MKIGVLAFFVGSAESFCFGGRWSNWSNCEIEEGKQCGTGARIRKRQCGFGSDEAQESETCEKGMHQWSEWSSCCSESDRQENIRLRKRGSNCGVEVVEFGEQVCTWIPFNPARPRHSCEAFRNGQRLTGRAGGRFDPDSLNFQAASISDRNYDNDRSDRPWYASRYGFQVKDLFENIFGTGSEENNEENVESPPVEDNSLQASSDSLVLATILENAQ